MKRLEFTFHADGSTTLEAHGYSGSGLNCQGKLATAPFEEKLAVLYGKANESERVYKAPVAYQDQRLNQSQFQKQTHQQRQ